MPVKDADPEARSLDDAFNEAMGTPPRPREPGPPPDVDPEAPFGRDDQGAPLAPFGLTKEGKPRRSNAGRKASADDRARIASPEHVAAATAASAAPNPHTATVRHDYTAALAEFADTVWFGLSALGKAGSAIPLVGKWIPEQKVAAEAYVLRTYKPNLVRAVNVSAQHNTRAARFAEAIETGDITWALTVGLLVMPFLTTSAAIWKDSEKTPAMAQSELPSVAELAERNDKQLDEYLAQLSAQLEVLAAAEEMAAQEAAAEAELAAAQEAGIL